MIKEETRRSHHRDVSLFDRRQFAATWEARMLVAVVQSVLMAWQAQCPSLQIIVLSYLVVLVIKGVTEDVKWHGTHFFAQVRASPSELDWEASQVGSESSLSLLWGRPDKQLDPGKLCPFSVLYLPPWLSWCLQNSCLFPEVNFNCGAFKHFKRWRARKLLNEALGENKC